VSAVNSAGRKKLLLLGLNMTELRYYGILTDFSGREAEQITLTDEATFAELRHLLAKKYPGFNQYPFVFFQQAKKCAPESKLIPGEVIDCMPPFSGG
jgi:molybdopterin converting factor small subunit